MAINNWWAGDPTEIYWMEITDRYDLGVDLRAPKADASGDESWSYTLTSYVQPGDRVFHWHKSRLAEPSIVAWSQAVGPLSTMTMSWQARGSRGRKRGAPTSGDAWVMPLAATTELQAPIGRSMINARYEEISMLLTGLSDTAAGSLYAPFQNYGKRELRAQQGYITKFPAALVDLLFGPSAQEPSISDNAPRMGQSQGYNSDAARRAAVEMHALSLAIEFYWDAGATAIEELGKPYDLRVLIDGQERHVEVKGSVGANLGTVQLTQGEVNHAASWQPTDLFVVDSIVCEGRPDGSIETSGGHVRRWVDWMPASTALRPTHLRYTLPH